MPGARLSTHVLDTGSGRPAAGVSVALFRGGDLLASALTDADGRVTALADDLAPGTYRLVFEVSPYFGGDAFFSRAAFDIEVRDDGRHHVPLLLSRHGLVTYRGS